MEYKFISLLVLGIASFSGAEAQECVAWGASCAEDSSVDQCCEGATCSPAPALSGGFCQVDNTCIAGGFQCADAEKITLCCQGYVCSAPVLGPRVGYCITEEYYNEVAAGK